MSLADVSSANIVGYSTLKVQSSYMIMGLNFESVDGIDKTISDVFPYAEGMTKGNATSTADQIQIMREDGGYNTYFLCNGKAGKATVTDGDGKWVKNGTTVVSTDKFPAGGGAWFVSVSADAKVKFAGPTAKTEE